MARQFDLVVIGTGTAASVVASTCRGAGWEVALIDSHPFGGTCSQRGCDPKKVLVAGAEAVDWARRMAGRGVDPGAIRIDWDELIAFKRSFTDPVPAARETAARDQGIAAFHGRARFESESSVRVGDEVLQARNIVIATGARPATLGIAGEQHLATSDAFLELATLPRSVAFVGGGYISCEFAHVARRAGAEVTILHRGPRLLERFDPDLVAQLDRHTRALGIQVQLGVEVKGVERRGGGYVVRAARDGAPVEVAVDLVVHGAGRVPDIDDLDLDRGRVRRGRGGIAVDQHFRSVSNPRVHAAGDCAETEGPPLTPVAGLEGRVLAANLLDGGGGTADYRGIPSVVFTIPPLATVGLGEEEARRQGLQVRVNRQDTSSWYSSRRRGESCSGFKVLVDERSDRIVGAHLLGPHAEELINLFGLAIRHGLTAAQLKGSIYAYPTHGSDVLYMV